MKARAVWIVAGIALLFGLAAGILLSLWWTNQRRHAEILQEFENQRPVVIFNLDLSAGTVLTLDHLKKIRMDEKFVTKSMVAPSRVDQVLGQELVHQVHAGDLLRTADIGQSK